MDQVLIRNLTEIVLKNLMDEAFGVEKLAKEAGMSRTNLYRKLQSNKHQNVCDFIREVRLQRAMELLQENQFTAAEVAYKVGFGSPTYFNKCFHDHYGFPPGEVKKRINEDNGDISTPEDGLNLIENENEVNPEKIGKGNGRGMKVTKWVPIILLFITILVSGWFLVDHYLLQTDSEAPKTTEKSIGVLPFRNESPDPKNEYLAAAITSEIFAHLQKVRGLILKSRSMTEQDWDEKKDLKTLGRKLGVDYIMEGSVQKVGDMIRITVQISEVNSGNQVWADSYDGIYNNNVLMFESEVAMKIASSMDLALTGDEIERIEHLSTRDIMAWDLVTRGVNMIYEMVSTGKSRYIDEALDFFNRAIEVDPQYARVYYGKGWAYLMIAQLDTAMYYADKAIELDPDDYLGYRLKGTLYAMLGDPQSSPDLAIAYLTKALDMEPEDYWTIFALGMTYCSKTDNVKKGLLLVSKALILCSEPKSSGNSINQWSMNSVNQWTMYKNIGGTLMNIGEYDLAEKYFKKTLAMGKGMYGVEAYCKTLIILDKPEEAIHLLDSLCALKECEMQCYFDRFKVYMMLGNYEEAEKSITKGFSYGEELNYASLPDLALMYKKLGRDGEALSILNELQLSIEERLSTRKRCIDYFINVKIFSILNEKEKALKNLSEAVKFGLGNDTDILLIHPVFENLREDPKFKAQVKKAQEKLAMKRAQVREMEEKGELAL